MTATTVRLARPRDAEAIADAHVRGWLAAYRGLVPNAILDGLSVERRATIGATASRQCGRRRSAPEGRQGPAPRRLRFAVDDAGAGYASFALIAALRPTVIKIDRHIVAGIARDDAKQALVEASVSFGRRIGARLLAEGIEKRSDLATVTALGVDLGQGHLLGRPATEPGPPRNLAKLGSVAARRVARVAAGHALARPTTTRRGAHATD